MSYKATNWAYDMKITGPAKPVLVALADMADEGASCFPGQTRLSEMTGLSVATVRRAVTRLEGLGLLTREHRYGAFGYRTSDRYQLQLGVTMPESLPLTEPTRHRAFKAESPSLPLTVQLPTAHSARAIEPLDEPLEEPSVRSDDDLAVDNNCEHQANNFGVDFKAVKLAVGKSCGRIPDSTVVMQLIATILDRASSPPKKPTAFIVAAVRNDWAEWQKFVDEAAA